MEGRARDQRDDRRRGSLPPPFPRAARRRRGRADARPGSAPSSGRTAPGRPSSAAPGDLSTTVEAYVALRIAGDPARCGAHEARRRVRARRGRRRGDPRLHAHVALAARPLVVGERAGAAARADPLPAARAALDLLVRLLGAADDRRALGGDRAAALAAGRARDRRAARGRAPDLAARRPLGARVRARSTAPATSTGAIRSRRCGGAALRTRRALDHRAAGAGRLLGRDPAALGLVDRRAARARPPARPSGARAGARRARHVHDRRRARPPDRGLPVAGVGHRALGDRAARRRASPAPTRRSRGPAAGSRPQEVHTRGDWAVRRPSSRRAAFRSSSPTTTTPTSTTPPSSCSPCGGPDIDARRTSRRAGSTGCSGCRAARAAGARSTSTTRAGSAPRSPSATSARSPTRRARMSPRTCSRRSPTQGSATSGRARRALEWLLREQERDGSWFGRWGANYLYGTGSVLPGARGVRPARAREHRRGGRAGSRACRTPAAASARTCAPTATAPGAGAASRRPRRPRGRCSASTPPAPARARRPRVRVRWLVETQLPDGGWDEPLLHGHRLPWRLLPQLPPLPRRLPGDGARPRSSGRPRESSLLVLAPLRVEQLALGPTPGARVLRTGMGPARARLARRARPGGRGDRGRGRGPLRGGSRRRFGPGDVVCATELRRRRRQHDRRARERAPRRQHCAAAGSRVHVGPILSARRILGPARAARAAGAGRSRSTWSRRGSPSRRRTAARGRPGRRRRRRRAAGRPALALAGPRALRSLRRVGPRSPSGRPRPDRATVLLVGPRSFCAGVERAIEIVELALARRGAPVYVRKQIVHNDHVVADLERRGAVFVEELTRFPPARPSFLRPRRLARGQARRPPSAGST